MTRETNKTLRNIHETSSPDLPDLQTFRPYPLQTLPPSVLPDSKITSNIPILSLDSRHHVIFHRSIVTFHMAINETLL